MAKLSPAPFSTPNRRVLAATLLSGLVVLLFVIALTGFLSAWKDMKEVVRDNQASRLVNEVDTNFQLAVSKGKNFAILKDALNKTRAMNYFKKAQERYTELSAFEQDPRGQDLLYKLGAALRSVEFSLGILTLTAQAKKSDPAEKLYRRYLKDITIDFDEASQAYVGYLSKRIDRAQAGLYSRVRTDLGVVLLGVLLAFGVIALSISVTQELRRALANETALKEKEERLQLFDDIAEEAVMIHDQGVIVEVNQALARLLGYDPFEIIGKHVSNFMDQGSTEQTKVRLQKGYSERTYEITAKRKDGSTFPLLVHGRDFILRGRKMRASSGWDITDRKKGEEALRRSEERFRNMLENSYESITLSGPDGKVIYISPSNKKLSGYDIEERLGKTMLDIVHPDDLPRARKLLGELIAEPGLTRKDQFRIHRKDGSLLECEFTLTNLLGNPDVNGILVNGRDVTERNRAERALRQSEENFRTLIESAPDAILATGDGKITYANKRCLELLRYKDLGELTQMKPLDVVHPDDQPAVLKRIERTLEGNKNPSVEIRMLRKDGTMVEVENTSVGVQLAGQLSTMVILRDITDRKKSMEALRNSEEKFRSMIENSHDVISVTGKDGRMTYISPSVKRVLGYEPSERIGQGYAQIMHPDDLERIKSEFAKLLGTKDASWTVEFRLRHKDGSWRYVESTGTNLLEDPAVGGIIYNLRDITEAKQAEQALRDSEESFRNLIENSNDVIVLVGVDGKTRYISPSVRKVMGYEPDERMGRSFMEIVHPDDQPLAGKLFLENAYKTGVTVNVEVRALHKDGTWRNLEVVASNLLDHPAIRGIIFNYRDTTEKKLAEENFKNLTERSPDAILIHKIEKILYVNPAFLKLTGYENAEELVGKGPEVIVPPEERKRVMARVKNLQRLDSYNPPAERTAFRKNGTRVPVEVVSFSILFQGSLAAVAVMRDLTEKKSAEQALMKFERLSTIGEMAAGIAHEIRNPLSAISAATQMLKRKKDKKDPAEDRYLDTITEQTHRLDRLVLDTLQYAKADRPLHQEPFSIKAALEAATRLCQVQFGPSHAKVTVEWDLPIKKELKLTANPQRVQQILINLILNAYQIMPEGGKLKIGLNLDEKSVFVRVEDTGPGIKEEDMKRLFEPFFTTKRGGSGLGLALSQRIAKEHGGEITVERVEPHGTAFVLRLPLKEGVKA